MQKLEPAERLIVAADFKLDPKYADGRATVHDRLRLLADKLRGTGVTIKVNSALRALGYGIIGELHDRKLKVFADLKLNDIPETLMIDGQLLNEAKPDIVTVMCSTGVKGMETLKKELPETNVLGVTVLTSLTEFDVHFMSSCSIQEGVRRYAELATTAKIDGLICSPAELGVLQIYKEGGMSLNTPGIRPAWSLVEGDDQNPDRVMTPAKAIKAGATRLVVGRPITQAQDPYMAVMKTIEEISQAL
jgi:orotidine-5'-phosphate decarboxylase